MKEQIVRVLLLGIFSRRAKKLFTEAEIEELAEYLSQNPKKAMLFLT